MVFKKLKKHNNQKNWLRRNLLYIELLVFVMPAVTILYIFLKNNVLLELSQMITISFMLVLVLAGLMTLRHIFDKFYDMFTLIQGEKNPDSEDEGNMGSESIKFNTLCENFFDKFEDRTNQLNHKIRELYIIKDIIEVTTRNKSMETLPNILLEKSIIISGAENGIILLLDSKGDRLHFIAKKGSISEIKIGYLIKSAMTLLPGILTEKNPFIVNNTKNENTHEFPGDMFSSALYLPIILQDKVIGLIVHSNLDENKTFVSDDIDILKLLTGGISFAMENQRLNSKLQKYLKEYQMRANELDEMNKSLQNEIEIRKLLEEEKNKLQTQLNVAQKLEALGTLAGGIAHNFNNLLMGIQGNASLIYLSIDQDDPNTKRAQNIEKLVQSGSKLTSQLLGYARKGKYEITPVDLNRLVMEISETFGNTRKEIIIHEDLSSDLRQILADQNQIEQVLFNLLINAADAMSGTGELFLGTRNCSGEDFKDKPYKPKSGIKYVLLTVRDTGEGMDKDTIGRVFEPFFSTKEPGKGTGLGLASCYGIIKGHGGFIDVDSEPENGTVFSIYLPASEDKYYQTYDDTGLITKGSGNILIVDDEELILEVSATLLRELGYAVIESKSGKKAIEVFEKHKDEIDMVILDIVMPDLSGEEVYDLLKEIKPDIKVLLASGFTLDQRAKGIISRGCNGFIKKPYGVEELSKKIKEIMDTGN